MLNIKVYDILKLKCEFIHYYLIIYHVITSLTVALLYYIYLNELAKYFKFINSINYCKYIYNYAV